MGHAFQMIDVGDKPTTPRLAVASGEIVVGPDAFALIRDRRLPKGDALLLAEVAGIQGAKKAYEMIPLCHPMGLDMVRIVTELEPGEDSVRVYCAASVHAKTGVEMEALAGVNAALLTIWDLTKMIRSDLRIGNVRLLAKRGGKSGIWLSPLGMPDWATQLVFSPAVAALRGRKAAVLTLSDRAARGEYADESGGRAQDLLERSGCCICDYRVVPDEAEAIRGVVREMLDEHAPDMLVTTGGTGLSARDVTPDVLAPLFDRTIPGIGELLRQDGAKHTALSWSSRAVGGVIGRTLVVTLPGNPKAVAEGLAALLPQLVPHLIDIIQGEKSDLLQSSDRVGAPASELRRCRAAAADIGAGQIRRRNRI